MLFQTLNAPLLSHLLYSSSEPHHSHTLLSVSYDPASTYPFLDLYPPCSPFPLTLRLTATKKVSIMVVSWSHSKRKRNATPQRRENPQRNLVTTTKERRREPKSLSDPTHTYTHLFEVLWLASLAVVQQPRRGRQGKLKAVPASGREPHQRRTDYYYYYLLLLPVLFGFSSSTTVCRRPPSLFL